MSKYRIIEIIDTSMQERETRKHVVVPPVVTFQVQELSQGFFRPDIHITLCEVNSMEKAIMRIEDLSGKFIKKVIHKVEFD